MSATRKHAANDSNICLSSARLPTFRTIEHHPHRQVAGKVFKAMDRARGGEEDVCWSKRLTRVAAYKFAGACGYEIDFVSRMWLLRISSAWRVDLNQQTLVLKDGGEALSFRSRQTFESFSDGGADAWIIRLHFAFFFVSHVGGKLGFFASYVRISWSKTIVASSA